jgi:Tfp pilus assembly protein PilP
MTRFVAGLICLLAFATVVVGQERLPIGTRVGEDVPVAASQPGTYEPAGYRDPFVSLVATKKGAGTPASARPRAGLAGLVLADVAVKGIVHNGANTFAVLEGPGGKSFVARTRDRLQDATVKKIEADSVTFVQQVVDVMGESHARDVRKSIRQQITSEEDR